MGLGICVDKAVGEHSDKSKTTVISSMQSFVKINDKKVLITGDLVVPHKSGTHLTASVDGSALLTINGKKVVLLDDVTKCGAIMVSGEEFATSD